MTKQYIQINFYDGKKTVCGYLVTDRIPNPDTMFDLLAESGFFLSKDTMKETYTSYDILTEAEAVGKFQANQLTLRKRLNHCDFFVRPEEQASDPVILSVSRNGRPVVAKLFLPNDIINADCSGQAIRLVLSDIAAEANQCDIKDVTWSDFLDAPQELLTKRNIRIEIIEPLAVLSDMPIIEKKTFTQTATITQKEADYIEQALTSADAMCEDDTFAITVTFPDRKQMDIKCCRSPDDEPAWTEAVLFNEHGCELTHSDVDEQFTGTWELSYNDTTYIVNVDIEPDEIQKLHKSAYQKYQLDWMQSHGYTALDLVKEVLQYLETLEEYSANMSAEQLFMEWEYNCGFSGEIWVCEEEFLSSEYLDEDYMQKRLTEQEYNTYLSEQQSSAKTDDTI